MFQTFPPAIAGTHRRDIMKNYLGYETGKIYFSNNWGKHFEFIEIKRNGEGVEIVTRWIADEEETEAAQPRELIEA
jgi:hypothetical protein